MKLMKSIFFSFALLTVSIATADEKSSDPGKAFGAPTHTDDLERKELGKKWAAAKGEWKITDGAIVGKELKADMHAAVLTLKHPNHNSAIQFSFQLDGTKAFNLSFNKKRGHLFRVAVTSNRVVIRLDKDKKDPTSKPKLLASGKAEIPQGKWVTMLVVVKGESVSVSTDTGLTLKATHADIDQAKPNYRFVMRGESLKLDNVKIWDLK